MSLFDQKANALNQRKKTFSQQGISAFQAKNSDIFKPGDRVCSGFLIETKLSQGSFGEVYLAYNEKNKVKVAIKAEKNIKDSTLKKEFKIMKRLAATEGVPECYGFEETPSHFAMAMSLFGESISRKMTILQKTLSLKTTLMIAIQMVSLLERLHAKGIVHRDLKPDNILMGLNGNSDKIHLVDFGLSKKIMKTPDDEASHIPFVVHRRFIGSLKFASVNSHYGRELSRRDDLESLVYMLIYICRGSLPWTLDSKLMPKSLDESLSFVRDIKEKTSPRTLTKGMPEEFLHIYKSIKGLDFEEKPNYKSIRASFRKAFDSAKLENDAIYDWSASLVNQPNECKSNTNEAKRKKESVREEAQTIKRARLPDGKKPFRPIFNVSRPLSDYKKEETHSRCSISDEDESENEENEYEYECNLSEIGGTSKLIKINTFKDGSEVVDKRKTVRTGTENGSGFTKFTSFGTKSDFQKQKGATSTQMKGRQDRENKGDKSEGVLDNLCDDYQIYNEDDEGNLGPEDDENFLSVTLSNKYLGLLGIFKESPANQS